MKRILCTRVVCVIGAALAVPVLAQSQQGGSGQQSQSLEQTKQMRKSQMQSEGGQQIQVPERAVYGLTEVAKDRMLMAERHLIDEPERAHMDLMVLADVIELQGALGQNQGQGQQQLQQMPGMQGMGGGQGGSQSAERVRDAAQRVEFKQLVTTQQLHQVLAQAALSLAQIEYQAAQQGLQQQDALRTAYPLKYASEFLAIAHTYSQKQPSDQVAKAIYDAGTLGRQMISLSQMTTGESSQMGQAQGGRQTIDNLAQVAGAQISGGGQQQQQQNIGQQAIGALGQMAGGQQPGQGAQGGQGGSRMQAEAQRVVQDLGQALQQSQTTIGQGQRQS